MICKYIKRDFIFLYFFKSITLLYDALSHPQAALHLTTKELHVMAILRHRCCWDVARCCSCTEGLSNSITFIIYQRVLTSRIRCLVFAWVRLLVCRGSFLLSLALGTQQTGTLQKRLESPTANRNIAKETQVRIRKITTLFLLYAIILLKFTWSAFSW